MAPQQDNIRNKSSLSCLPADHGLCLDRLCHLGSVCPVSTTHAIVGAITGAGISAFGLKGIQWDGIATIVLSWVISPVVSGVVCAMFFLFTKHFVLKHHDSFRRGLIAIPAYFG